MTACSRVQLAIEVVGQELLAVKQVSEEELIILELHMGCPNEPGLQQNILATGFNMHSHC